MRDHDLRKENFERGDILLVYAVAVVLSLMLVALVVDLGAAFVTYQRASTATQAAAFAAAQQVDMDEFYSTNEMKLDRGKAAAAAGQYATLNRDGLSIVSVDVYDDHVVVVGRMVHTSAFAHAIGFGTFETNITAIAYPAFGIDDRGQ